MLALLFLLAICIFCIYILTMTRFTKKNETLAHGAECSLFCAGPSPSLHPESDHHAQEAPVSAALATSATSAPSGFTLAGITADGALLVFSSDMSWNVIVYGVHSREWSTNDDPDFPRWVICNDLLHDLDSSTTYELAPVGV
jgi:hypothetical protein